MKKLAIILSVTSCVLGGSNVGRGAAAADFSTGDNCEYHYWDGQRVKCCPNSAGRWICDE